MLGFVVGFFSVGHKLLGHVVDDHADPLPVHDFPAADALKALIALLEGLENFIGVAGTTPALLLVKEARMFEEVESPLAERLPLSLVFCNT